MINYYNEDEKMCWLASKNFLDYHYGRALTEDELVSRKTLEDEYKEEIKKAKEIIKKKFSF